MDRLLTGLQDSGEMLELALSENDTELLAAVDGDLDQALAAVEKLEFQRMFSGPHDAANCFVDIQAGAGGTEAQDWAEMILRMYLRWAEAHGFAAELVEVSEGEVAGIKSASIHVKGDHAFGWLRTETGVHRLVRKSPFDSGNRRHTSFASVFIYPEIDDSFEIEINPADLKVDTYRASGAGGQHINKTDSAVRITHVPSGIVVACQTDRSQHKNRAEAMRMLRSKLYEMELQKREAEKQALEDSKSDIGWGHQIRSYVLDQSRIKDLRTSVEVGDTQYARPNSRNRTRPPRGGSEIPRERARAGLGTRCLFSHSSGGRHRRHPRRNRACAIGNCATVFRTHGLRPIPDRSNRPHGHYPGSPSQHCSALNRHPSPYHGLANVAEHNNLRSPQHILTIR